MAPIAVTVNIDFRGQRLGIGFRKNAPGTPVNISSIAHDGLFASSGLSVGMQVLSINNIPLDGMTAVQAIGILSDAEGLVIMVADNPVQAVVVPSAPVRKSGGYIILKKTFEYKPSGFQVSTEKSFSFHGLMTPDMVDHINQKLNAVQLSDGANRLQFKMNTIRHFSGPMNHHAQKHHEEDFVVAILEAMEELGYYFRFQYDAETFSTKMSGDSYTAKELFVFHRKRDDTV